MNRRDYAMGMLMVAAGSALVMALPQSALAANWLGTSGLGGDGEWNTSLNWSANTLPTSSDDVTLSGSAATAQILVSPTAEVPTGAGVAHNVTAGFAKTITFSLADTASLSFSGLLNTLYDPSQAGGEVTFAGPTSGAATANIARLYLSRQHTTADTVTFTGPHLTATMGSLGYAEIDSGNALVVTGGATLNSSDEIYIRTPGGNGLVSRMTVDGGQATATNVYVDDGQLLQLSSTGTLSVANVYIGNGGATHVGSRFEAAGTGLSTSGTLRIYGDNTLAVGLTDLNTHTRTSAESLTLHATAFDPGGIVQFGIFSSTSADQIAIASGSALTSYGVGVKLELTPYNFTPHAGDTYTLFTGDTAGITAPFDTSGVDTNVWDLTQFNQAGGWKVSVVPEPATLTLLGLGAAGLLLRRRKR